MARLPELDPAKFSPEQKKVHEAILKGPRGKVVGPLKVWLNNPGLAEHAQALGAYARFNSSLPPRLSELAICVTGAFWKANFEWYAHAPMAINAGIDPAAIEAIRVGSTPKLTKSDEQAVYDFASELVRTKRVSSATFERARQELGLTSVIDMVGIIGYYSLVSVTLNAFEIALPEGEKEPFTV
ncbi:MAG: 4-carboxymuconolactone decarboxylase [Hyphomicrobiales bacterium]|jgi:4-carboxymuconolactone decarboxylase|nr:4-carboxymuconolactone decarboxylase [Hyphomicrobiales bacterium]